MLSDVNIPKLIKLLPTVSYDKKRIKFQHFLLKIRVKINENHLEDLNLQNSVFCEIYDENQRQSRQTSAFSDILKLFFKKCAILSVSRLFFVIFFTKTLFCKFKSTSWRLKQLYCIQKLSWLWWSFRSFLTLTALFFN